MKQRISRRALEENVLAAVRAEPDCQDVQEISISAVKVSDGGSTWHVTVVSKGSVPFDMANHAAKRVQDRMVELYELDA